MFQSLECNKISSFDNDIVVKKFRNKIQKQFFSFRFLSEPNSKEYKYYQTKLKEKKAEGSSTSQTSCTSSLSASSSQQEPLNFDFAATLAQVRAKAAASLGGAALATPSITTQEMREREKQIREQREVNSNLKKRSTH